MGLLSVDFLPPWETTMPRLAYLRQFFCLTYDLNKHLRRRKERRQSETEEKERNVRIKVHTGNVYAKKVQRGQNKVC